MVRPHARRLLQERAATGKDLAGAHRVLREMLATDREPRHQLRAIWALHATGGLDEKARLALLDDPSPQVRAWGVRLLVDDGRPSATAIDRLGEMARASPSRGGRPAERSMLVRLWLASAMQRIPEGRRWPIAEALAMDHAPGMTPNHTLLIWYGLEALVARDRDHAATLLARCPNPTLCRFIARRTVAADVESGLAALLPVLRSRPGSYPAFHRAVLDGALEAVQGRKRADAGGLAGCRPTAGRSGGFRGPRQGGRAGAPLRRCDGRGGPAIGRRGSIRGAGARHFALQNLVDRRTAGLSPVLFRLLDDPELRGPAIRALAAYNEPSTPQILLKRYTALSPAERDDAIATLASRPAGAAALLDAIRAGVIPRRDVNTTIARQILAFGDPKLAAALEASWGRAASDRADKAPLIAKYKAILASDSLPAADPDRGRALFGRICAQCHKLFGQGGDVGPDLTGSDRANPDYILENVLDPSASVGKDYTLTTVATSDGRLVAGIVRERSAAALVIQTASERITLPREDVNAIKTSNASMMPEGQLDPLTPQEVRDLFAYLAATKPGRAN